MQAQATSPGMSKAQFPSWPFDELSFVWSRANREVTFEDNPDYLVDKINVYFQNQITYTIDMQQWSANRLDRLPLTRDYNQRQERVKVLYVDEENLRNMRVFATIISNNQDSRKVEIDWNAPKFLGSYNFVLIMGSDEIRPFRAILGTAPTTSS